MGKTGTVLYSAVQRAIADKNEAVKNKLTLSGGFCIECYVLFGGYALPVHRCLQFLTGSATR
jgi:hypothetical protein